MANSGMTQLLGFRFDPTDQEIIGFFLYKMVVANNPLTSMPPYNKVIHKCNLFGNKREPSEIWRDYGGDQLDDQDLETVCASNARLAAAVLGVKPKPTKMLKMSAIWMDKSGKKRKCSSQDQSNKKMKRDQSKKEMKTENSVGPQIMNDESNQLMINDITTCDQDYLIDTNHKSFNIDELFVELDRKPPLLHSQQQLPQIVESQEKPLPTSCLCVNQFDGPLEAATSNLGNFEYNS
ncbi:unnamed protein product [Prunus brigantina]